MFEFFGLTMISLQARARMGAAIEAWLSGVRPATPPPEDPLPRGRQKLPGDIFFIVATYLKRPRDIYHLLLCSREMYLCLRTQLLKTDVGFDKTSIGKHTQRGCTSALVWSIERGVTENIIPLIKKAWMTRNKDYLNGMSYRSKRIKSISPLHAAVLKGDLKTVKLLVRSGCDLNIMYIGPPALFLTCSHGAHYDCRRPNNQCKSAVTMAIEGNHMRITSFLLRQRGIRLDHGVTALHAAVLAQQPRVVQRLLDMGQNPNRYTANQHLQNFTALQLAVSVGDDNSEIIEMLCEAGANMEVIDQRHRTPLRWAIVRNRRKHAATLVACGAATDDFTLWSKDRELLKQWIGTLPT